MLITASIDCHFNLEQNIPIKLKLPAKSRKINTSEIKKKINKRIEWRRGVENRRNGVISSSGVLFKSEGI